MRTACAPLFCGFLFLCATTLAAQNGGPMPSSTLSGGINLRAAAGAPFSADVVKETVQVLADGTRVQAEVHGKMFRDAEGRTRSETELANPQAGAEPKRFITIIDPVLRLSYVLNVATKTALVFHLPAASAVPARAMKLAAAAQAAQRSGTGHSATAGEEDLGTNTIEGFLVAGTRRTRSAEAGATKDTTVNVVTQTWFSPDLKVELLSTQVSPSTTRTTRLKNIVSGEPDPALFQVPADYAVQEGSQPK